MLRVQITQQLIVGNIGVRYKREMNKFRIRIRNEQSFHRMENSKMAQHIWRKKMKNETKLVIEKVFVTYRIRKRKNH